MKVNERRTVVRGVDWPLCVPPTVERDRRACASCILAIIILSVLVFITSRYSTETSPGEIETPGFHRMIA